MKSLISAMLASLILSTTLCGCIGNTDNTSKSEDDQAKSTEGLISLSTPVTSDTMSEEATEPLTAEESMLIDMLKDYFTAIEKMDIDAVADFYDPAVLPGSDMYKSLRKIYDDACDSGIASDDYEGIWKQTEKYEGLNFTFNNYASCDIIGNSARASIDYLADFTDRGYPVQYSVKFGFTMTRINDEWYLSSDPDYDNAASTYNADDFENPYSAFDTAYNNAESINLIINKCYKNIQDNNLEKYTVKSGKFITVADAVKVFGRAYSFFTVENNGHRYTPYWYKTGGYCVFLDSEGNNLIIDNATYNNDEIISLAENNNPSNSVYVVDLFR